jgi:hypothetical protein
MDSQAAMDMTFISISPRKAVCELLMVVVVVGE